MTNEDRLQQILEWVSIVDNKKTAKAIHKIEIEKEGLEKRNKALKKLLIEAVTLIENPLIQNDFYNMNSLEQMQVILDLSNDNQKT